MKLNKKDIINQVLEKRRVQPTTRVAKFTEFKKVCKLCQIEFWTIRPTVLHCSRNCSNQTTRSIQNPMEKFFREKMTRLRHNAKGRGIGIDVTWQELLEQYNLQKGKCYYTNEDMQLIYSTKTHKVCPPKQLSVDRVDSNKPYTKSNIVLCCYNINNFKGDMEMEEFTNLINKIFRRNLNIKFKKLNPNAVAPTIQKLGDAGADLQAISKTETSMYTEYGTGIAIQLPPNTVGLLFPRSSCSLKTQVLANCVGVIDENFRGEIKLRFKNTAEGINENSYEVGDRVGQLIVIPREEMTFEQVAELDETIRGKQGFGSSGT